MPDDEQTSADLPTGGEPTEWCHVMGPEGLDEGRVMTVSAGEHTLALTRCDGRYGALDNRCPHQGGPLGEGSIENGLLRCPWHGFDYDPLTGESPGNHGDRATVYPVEVRDDGVWVQVPAPRPHERTVGDVIVETMIAWGITHVFGMVGHSNLGIADSLHRAEARGELTYIGIRHEGAAAFAASAIGKLTGRPAACLAIAGPGSTNLLTGLYDAKSDSAPVLAISGQVPSKVLGQGAFQDLDLTGAFSDVALISRTVLAGSAHSALTARAIKTAVVGNGVAHLVIPDEVQVQPAGRERVVTPAGRMGDDRVAPHPDVLTKAVEAIDGAQRPVVIVGAGAHDAMDDIIAFAEHLGAPVITTFKAKGQISDLHPLACGVIGRSGTPVASWIMNECDRLIVFGASFSNHSGIAPYKPIVQVDHDPLMLGRFDAVEVPVLGDCGVTARDLLTRTADAAGRDDQAADVAARWSIWRAEKTRRAADDHGRGVSAAAVFESMSRMIPDDAIISVDVGNNTYSFGRYFECEHHTVLMSGYLGSIGFGYPAAIGAACAEPHRRSIAVTGDGGFGQYLAEVTTAVKYGLPIVHVLLDNAELGKISKEQRAVSMDVWQTSLHNPDFAAYAELCGALGIKVERRDQLDDAFRRALDHDGPSMIHVVSDVDLV